jgi:hypothetical protein
MEEVQAQIRKIGQPSETSSSHLPVTMHRHRFCCGLVTSLDSRRIALVCSLFFRFRTCLLLPMMGLIRDRHQTGCFEPNLFVVVPLSFVM